MPNRLASAMHLRTGSKSRARLARLLPLCGIASPPDSAVHAWLHICDRFGGRSPMGRVRWLRVAMMLGGLLGGFVGRSDAQSPLTFEKDIRPLLKSYCLDCHGGGEK